MFRMRRALPWAAVLLLLLQVGIGGTSLSAMAPDTHSTLDAVCTCFHGAEGHAMCPMHHTKSGESRCRVRGMDDLASTALASLLAPLAAPVSASAARIAPASSVVAPVAIAQPIRLAVSPDLPPPRS